MVDTYNFSEKTDLRHFISILLDDYCPDQLEGIDSDLVYDAIKSLKQENLELTGNMIYTEAIYIGVNKTNKQIINWREYLDEMEISQYEINKLDKFANKLRAGGLLEEGIIEYFANGSMDSSVYLSPSIDLDDKEALKILNAKTDILEDLSENIGLDISCLESEHTEDITEEL